MTNRSRPFRVIRVDTVENFPCASQRETVVSTYRTRAAAEEKRDDILSRRPDLILRVQG